MEDMNGALGDLKGNSQTPRKQTCVLHSRVSGARVNGTVRALRVLQCGLAALFVPDADGLIHVGHEDFAVTDFSGFGRAQDGLNS
jgi:hypothetical protein